MPRIQLATVLVTAILASSSGCSGKKEVSRENRRLWGREKFEQEFADKAHEAIDSGALEERPDLRSRILNMRFEEVIARLGFVEYTGNARFLLKRNGHTIDVPESSVIRHGLHGSSTVKQLDQDGEVTREVIYNNGVLYGRNGPKGKMRVMGMVKKGLTQIRDEAWQPLRVFSSYYGPRFGMLKSGSSTVNGRRSTKYRLALLEGSALIEVPGMKGKKKPISLDGALSVDDETGVPIQANLKGRLEIPSEKPDRQAKRAASEASGDGSEGFARAGPVDANDTPGELDLELTFDVKTIEGTEIKPKEFIPEIKRREVDLDPLAFLSGETRTSTVIGGRGAPPPRPAPAAPPPAVEAAPKEPATPPVTAKSTKRSKKLKRKAKKRK